MLKNLALNKERRNRQISSVWLQIFQAQTLQRTCMQVTCVLPFKVIVSVVYWNSWDIKSFVLTTQVTGVLNLECLSLSQMISSLIFFRKALILVIYRPSIKMLKRDLMKIQSSKSDLNSMSLSYNQEMSIALKLGNISVKCLARNSKRSMKDQTLKSRNVENHSTIHS